MISLVIPVIDQHDLTFEAVRSFYCTSEKLDLVLIDNGSKELYENYSIIYEHFEQTFKDISDNLTVIRNNENVGLIKSLEQGIEAAKSDIVVYTHNDVKVYTDGWDTLIKKVFNDVPNLAVAGFFGAMGVHPNGGRWRSQSRMMGHTWGSGWKQHGEWLQGEYSPAAVLDGLCMIFNKKIALKEGFPPGPIHHWYDRTIPLYYIDKGYKCATIGVKFDHKGGMTSSKEGYWKSAKKWCEENNIQVNEENNYDLAIYKEGERLFTEKWANRLPLIVDEQFNYRWTKGE